MQLSNDQILLLSELLIKVLKHDIQEKNKIEEIPDSFIEFNDLIKVNKEKKLKFRLGESFYLNVVLKI